MYVFIRCDSELLPFTMPILRHLGVKRNTLGCVFFHCVDFHPQFVLIEYREKQM